MNSTITENKNNFFYGWVIVCVSTFSLLVSNGLSIGGLPVFYKSIQEDLLALGTLTPQTKDAVIGLAAGLTFLLSGISSLVVGLFIKKISLRRLMMFGCVVLGGGLLFYSRAVSPLDVYIAHSLFGVALGFVGVIVQTVLVANWFRRRRGTALGIVLLGTSLGGVAISAVATPLIGSYGWRASMQILSLLVWVILIPATFFLVRDKPEDIGENFDGDEAPTNVPAGETAAASGATFAEALKSPLFWVLAICAALIFYPIFAVSQQFNLYLQNNVGISKETAGFAQSVLFATSIAGKFLFGWLCDRFPVRGVIMICCGVMFLSTLMLLGFLDASTIFVFLIPFGLGYGGTFVLIQLLTVENFGLRDIGKILGAIILIETSGGFIGSVITGKLASLNNGDYKSAFYGVTIAAGLAFASTFVLYLLSGENKYSEKATDNRR